MERLIVHGGKALSGVVTPAGNKNEALPALAACLLSPKPVTLHNVPHIGDTRAMRALLRDLGVEESGSSLHGLTLDSRRLKHFAPDVESSGSIRGSILLAAPLLARFGEALLPLPGGDRIGWRRIDTHLHALRSLGARFEQPEPHLLRFTLPQKRFIPAAVFLDEASVTATENAVMAASTAEGESVIENAASEPHVQSLCLMLRRMGAQIEGIGTNRLVVQGTRDLQGCTHHIAPDPIEVGSFIGLAAVTGGCLRIRSAGLRHLNMIRLVFARLGVCVVSEGDDLLIPAQQQLEVIEDHASTIPLIADGPWPAFPSDLMSIVIVVATQAKGTVQIFEKMFENRLYWIDRLISMGGRLIPCDPYRAIVMGPSPLRGTTLTTPDIRAGMALLIAALGAQGRSEIQNIHQIDRGYQNIDQRLRALGADIERIR